MAKNLKKIEYAQERNEIAGDIKSIRNLKNIAQEKKDEIIQDLLQKGRKTSGKLEKKEPELFVLQNKILSKPNMTTHHRQWFQKRTDELIEDMDKSALEQLDENFYFSENGGLIIHTSKGLLKFSPKQASFDDVKNIDGIQEDKNVWTENKQTGKKGLWTSIEANEMMIKAGKKICSCEQYEAALNAFPGRQFLNSSSNLYSDMSSFSVGDFFDLLGVNQLGVTKDGVIHDSLNERYLWSAEVDYKGKPLWEYIYCPANGKGRANLYFSSLNNTDFGCGVWFLED